MAVLNDDVIIVEPQDYGVISSSEDEFELDLFQDVLMMPPPAPSSIENIQEEVGTLMEKRKAAKDASYFQVTMRLAKHYLLLTEYDKAVDTLKQLVQFLKCLVKSRLQLV